MTTDSTQDSRSNTDPRRVQFEAFTILGRPMNPGILVDRELDSEPSTSRMPSREGTDDVY